MTAKEKVEHKNRLRRMAYSKQKEIDDEVEAHRDALRERALIQKRKRRVELVSRFLEQEDKKFEENLLSVAESLLTPETKAKRAALHEKEAAEFAVQAKFEIEDREIVEDEDLSEYSDSEIEQPSTFSANTDLNDNDNNLNQLPTEVAETAPASRKREKRKVDAPAKTKVSQKPQPPPDQQQQLTREEWEQTTDGIAAIQLVDQGHTNAGGRLVPPASQ